MFFGIETKKEVTSELMTSSERFSFELSYLDSNQDKQNQNLLCYHYTIGQSSVPPFGKAVQVFVPTSACKLAYNAQQVQQNTRVV